MKRLAIIPFVCLLTVHLSAQNQGMEDGTNEVKEVRWRFDKDKNLHGNFALTFQPSRLITHQDFHIGYELRLKKSRSWLQWGLSVPFSINVIWEGKEDKEDNIYTDDILLQYSIGLNFNYKYFFHRYLYVASGPSWHYYNIHRDYSGWFDFEEDGIKYTEYGNRKSIQKINNFGWNVTCGFQRISRKGFLMDAYVGVAAQKAVYSEPDSYKYNSTMYSRGYTGCVFLIGFKIGGAFKTKSYL
ncbi:MAG: hypothetical protein LBU62_11480 [Bacteroidales bacterium]|jgi:hypothetical protein|nr:hypothetical protein [Bacteroidales bacterium]